MQVVLPSVTIHIPGVGLGGLGFDVVVDGSVVEDIDVLGVVSVVVSKVVAGVVDVEGRVEGGVPVDVRVVVEAGDDEEIDVIVGKT